MKTIREQFDEIMLGKLPIGADSAKVSAMRSAFFAGFAAAFFHCQKVATMEDDKAVSELQKIDEEIEGFAAECKKVLQRHEGAGKN